MSAARESDPIQFDQEEIRSLPQNARFHCMVRDIARQVKWADEYMDDESWKRLFLAAYYGQKMVPNPLDPQAPFIVINKQRSRDLVKRGDNSMRDLLSEIEAFGASREVQWTHDE